MREILGLPPMQPLEGVGAHIRGTMNRRGATLPIFDLGMRFGVLADSKKSCVIVVNALDGAGVMLPSLPVAGISPPGRFFLYFPLKVGAFFSTKAFTPF